MRQRGARGWSSVTSAMASKSVVPARPSSPSLTKIRRSIVGQVAEGGEPVAAQGQQEEPPAVAREGALVDRPPVRARGQVLAPEGVEQLVLAVADAEAVHLGEVVAADGHLPDGGVGEGPRRDGLDLPGVAGEGEAPGGVVVGVLVGELPAGGIEVLARIALQDDLARLEVLDDDAADGAARRAAAEHAGEADHQQSGLRIMDASSAGTARPIRLAVDHTTTGWRTSSAPRRPSPGHSRRLRYPLASPRRKEHDARHRRATAGSTCCCRPTCSRPPPAPAGTCAACPPPESVADHVFGTGFVALVLMEMGGADLDREKVLTARAAARPRRERRLGHPSHRARTSCPRAPRPQAEDAALAHLVAGLPLAEPAARPGGRVRRRREPRSPAGARRRPPRVPAAGPGLHGDHRHPPARGRPRPLRRSDARDARRPTACGARSSTAGDRPR